jgi:transposase InsO family protein
MVGEATTEQLHQVTDINEHLRVGNSPDAPKVAPTVAPIQSATEPATPGCFLTSLATASPRPALSGANQEWALDFAHDAIATDRKIRVLSVVDVYTRECLALEVDTGFASRRVTRVLDEVINGPELTSRHFLAWALERKIELRHIQRASQRRTHTWRASMAGCARSACR